MPRKSFLAAACAAAVVASAHNASAATFGLNDIGHVAMLQDRDSANTDTVNGISGYTEAFTSNYLILPGTSGAGNTAESITDGNRPGQLYAISEQGALFSLDWYRGTATFLTDLDPPGGSDDTTYDSITNDPGSNRLFIHRSGAGVGEIDTYDTQTGAVSTAVWTTVGTGDKAISDGPDGNIYVLATGGNFEVFDPSLPGGVSTVISSGTAGLVAGDLVSLAQVPGDPDSMAILQDTDSGGDRIHLFHTDGTRTNNVVTTAHTGAVSISDSPRGDNFVYSVATGGSAWHGDLTNPGSPITNGDVDGTQNGTEVGVALVAPSKVERYVYIADDGTANHADLFDTQYRTDTGFYNNVVSGAATTTAQPGTDFVDVSVTDGRGADGTAVYQLHTDGSLYAIDIHTGAGADTPIATLSPTDPGDLTTFDSITNHDGQSDRLFILRNDRSLGSKTSMPDGVDDAIDVYDLSTNTYVQDFFTTENTGTISISDGPMFDFGDGLERAIYTIATGGAFEAFAVDGTGQAVISTGTPNGEYVSLTNIPNITNGLFALRDADGTDFIDFLLLDGTEINNLFSLAMTGAASITDTYEGDLLAIATGAAASLIDINRFDLASSTVFNFTFSSGTYASVTNLASSIPEPASAGLLAVGCVLMAQRRRRAA